MIRKSIKYLFIAIVNMVILLVLLAFSLDDLELLFNWFAPLVEFLKIMGVTILALIAMRILVEYFRRKKIYDKNKKMGYSVLLTILVCSPLYFNYMVKAVTNKFINTNARASVYAKLESAGNNKVDGLSFEEYNEMIKVKGFPKIPESSRNISVSFYEDGFLPDFSISLTYEVPIAEKVEEINYTQGQYSQSVSVEEMGQYKKVFYEESEW